MVKPLPQKIGKAQPGQTDFHKIYKRKTFHNHGFRKNQQQKIQRACQVVGRNCPEIHSKAAVPAIKQAVEVAPFILQLRKERHILMIGVNNGNSPVTKRPHSLTYKGRHGRHKRDNKCQNIPDIFMNPNFSLTSHIVFLLNPLTSVQWFQQPLEFLCYLHPR